LIKNKEDDGSILVFLPGAPEISLAANIIRRITKEMMVELLPLHGGLQPKEQNLVFKRAAAGFTKVILSTNVAETSITIPDCTCVVDTCREKQSSYDPINRMPLLVERFASTDSLKQRRGRAGRIRSGAYYQLISPKAKAKLLSHGIPEICRCALDSVILLLLYIGLENGKGSFISTLLDPPSQDSIESSLHSLIKLNAVKASSDGSVQLTPLGVHLAGIPAPPVVGKCK
jgi:ATP-dependent RNA helicase DHX57